MTVLQVRPAIDFMHTVCVPCWDAEAGHNVLARRCGMGSKQARPAAAVAKMQQ